ncbi:hypothetical protein Sango_2877100 [Sesamum angolense]|uniref:Reverse transcriptase domain-containing protein n=1 Tax=Sesamum angolense TaxID=2727404 RepID=A0AAE1T6K1_9LAMI|nr:hypothetical protein Sango_2877100 [Sesamum angolense]
MNFTTSSPFCANRYGNSASAGIALVGVRTPWTLFKPPIRFGSLKLSRGIVGLLAMEDVIEGGPWLFQGQPIVLQAWEHGMSLRRQNTLSPVLRNGKEDPKRIDIEYEWLPQKCKTCCSLGHTTATCPANMKTKPDSGWHMIKLASWNVRGLNGLDHQRAVEQVRMGLNLFTVVHSTSDCIQGISDEPWLILGDFNAVIDTSEVCGQAADTSASMADFRNCVRDTGLVQLPFTGCPFTWHNCSEGPRSLWKRLDRMLVNEAWLDAWPGSSYISALPSTSDHSPLILTGMDIITDHTIFRFDNYLAQLPGFLESVQNIWKHRITGTAMYAVVCKLKNLKAEFRRQKKLTGDLTTNVKKAKLFLDKAQAMFDKYKEDIFLNLVKCCRRVYATAIKLEIRRSISDNILLAQELLAGYNQTRLPARCTLKIDIQKAYDSVEWDFLLEVLRLFNFPQQFIMLIEQCISTASFSISLNGSIYGFFKGGRGLRQGDPISPYLFVLVMEIWSTLIRHRVQNATQFQHHWNCKDIGLVTLCFAYDVLLFCLRVNPAKSQTILSRAVQQDRQQILESVGFREGSLPIKYLGSSGSGNAKVAWDQLCKPKAEGGLGIRSLLVTNQALILKQLWRILHNDGTSIWVDWIQQYRLRHTTLWTFNRAAGSWGWKKMLKLRPILQRGVTYRVGDGLSFSLWQDIWHVRGQLCLNFPRGPEVTGLPLNSTLSSVLQHNHWSWPASTDSDITEIMSQLPPTFPSIADP